MIVEIFPSFGVIYHFKCAISGLNYIPFKTIFPYSKNLTIIGYIFFDVIWCRSKLYKLITILIIILSINFTNWYRQVLHQPDYYDCVIWNLLKG